MANKKKTLGFKSKALTLEQIEQAYREIALQAGHKALLASNTLKIIENTQREIEEHFAEMNTLQKEAAVLRQAQQGKLVPPAPPPAPAQAPVPVPAPEVSEEAAATA